LGHGAAQANSCVLVGVQCFAVKISTIQAPLEADEPGAVGFFVCGQAGEVQQAIVSNGATPNARAWAGD